MNHARGFERLIELRGPEAFTALPELMILERTRSSVIFAALVLRKRTILTKPEWKSVPWKFHPGRKTPKQMLLDIFADCPGLRVAKTELELEHSTEQTYPKRQDLAIKVQGSLKELEGFEVMWESLHPTCA